MRQLPLRSPTKTIIIWHSKEIKTFTIRGLELFYEIACSKKFWISIGKCQLWNPVYIKSWGNESNLFDFSRIVILSAKCEYMQYQLLKTKKFISFIRGVFRAWSNIHDEAKYIKCKFISFFFQPHFLYLPLSPFK